MSAETAEAMTRGELMHDIRSVLGISVYGTAATITSVNTRRIVATLEMLPEEQLRLLLAVCHRASTDGEPDNDETARRTNSDLLYIRDLLYLYNLKDLFLLASVIERVPEGMGIRDATRVLSTVGNAMFDLSTEDKIVAHLHTSYYLSKLHGKGYDLHLMLLVQTHPDKTDTIVTLAGTSTTTPTHPDVMKHHQIEPAFYGGVL